MARPHKTTSDSSATLAHRESVFELLRNVQPVEHWSLKGRRRITGPAKLSSCMCHGLVQTQRMGIIYVSHISVTHEAPPNP